MTLFKIPVKYILIVAAIVAVVSTISLQCSKINELKIENDIAVQNVEWLKSKAEFYKTTDSSSAVSLRALTLSIEDYAAARRNDLKDIAKLRADLTRIKSISTAQLQSIYEINAVLKDKVFQTDSTYDTLPCLNYSDRWYDFSGCIYQDSVFIGSLNSFDSIVYVEHIVPKKFWFIKWGVKERRQEILSKNPHTKIVNAEYITIRE